MCHLEIFTMSRLKVVICYRFRVATWSGNQEKSGKIKKNDKSQEI